MKVTIIYNPKSTGAGKQNADRLAHDLRSEGFSVEVRHTTHPGHGEAIAKQLAARKEENILISSSGDGGYHEVVNGVLSVTDSRLIVGVLPSGNANDHASSLGSGELVQAIREMKVKRIDVLKIEATVGGRAWTRYAHSYASIGISVAAAHQLTKQRPNALTEKWIVARSLFSFRSIKVRIGGKVRRYSSIVFSNIDRMSKVIKLSDWSSVSDGKFEVNAIRFRSKLRLVLYLLTAATIGLRKGSSRRRFVFYTVRTTPIQLDGEVYQLDSSAKVVVSSEPTVLRCLL